MSEDDEAAPSARMPGHLIRRLHQLSTRVFTRRLAEAGIDLTPIQFAALDALRHRTGIDQARLAHAIAKDRATIGGVVDRLEQKGLVTRNVSARDKRARELALTSEGGILLERAEPLVSGLQAEILPGLSDEEYEAFVALAAKAAATADTEGD